MKRNAPGRPTTGRPTTVRSLAHVLIPLLVGAFLLLGCAPAGSSGSDGAAPVLGGASTSSGSGSQPATDADRRVQRILPLRGNISEVVFALGLGDRVIGRDESATFPEAASLPLVTKGHEVSPEAVLSLRPTLVLAQSDDGPPEALDAIRSAGVEVLVVPTPKTIDDISPRIRSIATTLGREAAGNDLATTTERKLVDVQRTVPSAADPPKVAFLYMRGQAGVYLIAGKGSGVDSMIAAAGGIDAGTALGLTRSFTPITSEALAQAAPDIILMTTTGLASVGGIEGLVDIPGIAQTPAGKNRRVVTQEDGLLFSFGARTPQSLRSLIDELYPDRAP